MSKGFVVNPSNDVLAFGYDGEGTKIERLKAGNEFVTSASDKPRYDVLFAEMRNPTPPPLPDIDDIKLSAADITAILIDDIPAGKLRAARELVRAEGRG